MGFKVLELCNTADNKGTGKNEFTSLFGNVKVGPFPRFERSEWNPVC